MRVLLSVCGVLAVLCMCGLGIGAFQALPAQETKTPKTNEKDGILPSDAVWESKYSERKDLHRLKVIDNRITFLSLDQGQWKEVNDCTGEIIPGKVPVVVMKFPHHGELEGYTSVFTGTLVEKGRIVGTWYDNAGEFRATPGEWTLQQKK